MKGTKKSAGVVATAMLGVMLFMGCYGQFALTKKMYAWNGTLGDKFVNSAVTWVMLILPAYEIAGVLDFVVFNTLEFWTGKNPLAMQGNETETRTVRTDDGQEYRITASKNRFDIHRLREDGTREQCSLVYDDSDGSFWAETADAGRVKISQADLQHPGMLALLDVDGSVAKVVDLGR